MRRRLHRNRGRTTHALRSPSWATECRHSKSALQVPHTTQNLSLAIDFNFHSTLKCHAPKHSINQQTRLQQLHRAVQKFRRDKMSNNVTKDTRHSQLAPSQASTAHSAEKATRQPVACARRSLQRIKHQNPTRPTPFCSFLGCHHNNSLSCNRLDSAAGSAPILRRLHVTLRRLQSPSSQTMYFSFSSLLLVLLLSLHT